MSWTQGIQERGEIAPSFIELAEKKAAEQGIEGQLQYVTWFDSEPDKLICDFGDAGSITLRFHLKAA